jgi:L-rhamnose-H+ transport protein
VLGIVVAGYAGVRKERELPSGFQNDDLSGDSEFAPVKGILLAIVCGFMSACFAYGIQTGGPIAAESLTAGAKPIFQNNAVLCVILLGGLLTNTLWCLYLNKRNGTFGSYASATPADTFKILFLCCSAGVIWYFQFFFYGMGTTRMGEYDFSSWSLHMAFIIICGNLWGLFFKEWRGVSAATLRVVWIGILLLVISVSIIGWGNSLAGPATH